MQEIKVSIITPSYNQGIYIEQTIISVLSQTYKNIEYIIIDGGSTDDTKDVINKYKDRIDFVISERDNGQSDAINKGFKIATGDYVGWINSDDLLYPNCIEEIVKLVQKEPDCAILYSERLDFIDSKGILIETKSNYIPNRKHLLYNNYNVFQPCSFYKREIINKIGLVDVTLNYCMDLDLWLRLLNHGKIYAYKINSLGAFRVWEESKTNNGGVRFLREIRETLLKHGSPFYSRNIIRTYWYSVKLRLKAIFK